MPVLPPTFRPRGARTKRDHDRERAVATPTRLLYRTARWRRLRAEQLAAEPLCRLCAEEGRTTRATVCDHVEPHRGDVDAFWRGPFQSLCDEAPQRCHSRVKQREERARRPRS